MTYDFNGYEINSIRRGSPDDVARSNIELVDSREGCDLSPTHDKTVATSEIFNSSGGIDLTKLVIKHY